MLTGRACGPKKVGDEQQVLVAAFGFGSDEGDDGASKETPLSSDALVEGTDSRLSLKELFRRKLPKEGQTLPPFPVPKDLLDPEE